MRQLFSIVLSSDGRLERQIRAWAAVDKAANVIVKGIDKQRIAYTKSLLTEIGFDNADASARATFAYRAMVRQFTLGLPPMPKGQLSKQF